MRILISLYRFFRVLGVTVRALIRLKFSAGEAGTSPKIAASHARCWAATLVNGLSIEVTVAGNPPGKGGALLVANHRSYLDIVIILAQVEAAFLAKAELRRWPVFGRAALRGNTVFVDRADPQSRARSRQALADLMEQGICAVVFPEGTTSRGPGLLPFKNGIFHMAAQRGIPVIPVSVCYENPDTAWVGDDTFIPHFLRLFKNTPIRAHLTFGQVLEEADGARLKRLAHTHIATQLKHTNSFQIQYTCMPNGQKISFSKDL